jgi:hypothetical protein
MSTVALDFDGVLSDYSGWRGHDAPLEAPVAGAIQAIRDYQDAGFEVVIYTTRADSVKSIARIIQWLKEWGLEYARVNKIDITSLKPPAIIYIDDLAFCFQGIFPSVKFVTDFKTWKGL